jgi:hypothetical protein
LTAFVPKNSRKMHKISQKGQKNAFFQRKVWSVQKKAVPLQSVLRELRRNPLNRGTGLCAERICKTN